MKFFVHPASIEDAVFFDGIVYRSYLIRQIELGPAWVIGRWGNPRVLSLFGLAKMDDGSFEAWFVCRPQFVRVLKGAIRHMRDLLAHYGERTPIRCTIKPGHAPGEKLARLLNFIPTGEIFHAPGTPVDGVQFWRYNP